MKEQIQIGGSLRLTTLYQTLLTVPKVGTFTVDNIHIVNTSAADQSVDLCFVPDGQVESETNALLFGYTIPANDFLELDEGDHLEQGVVVRAKASANNALNVRMSGTQK